MAHKKKEVLLKRKEAKPPQVGKHDHHDRLCAVECALIELSKQIHQLITQGVTIMASMKDLQDKIDALEVAESAREARDKAQDEVTAAQIAALNVTLEELKAIIAGGSLNTENQAILDRSVTRLDAVVTSLDAADPTPPVV